MSKHNRTMKSRSVWAKCVKSENKKQLTQKEYKSVKVIQTKVKHNAKLKSPHLILNMSKNILKRKKHMSKKVIKAAHKMIKKAESTIKKNKKKKLKNITLKELALLNKFHKELLKKIDSKC